MAKFKIIQQESCGQEHWRALRDDGNRRIGGYYHVDMPTLEDAEAFVESIVRRENLGPSEVSVRKMSTTACDIRTVGAEVASV